MRLSLSIVVLFLIHATIANSHECRDSSSEVLLVAIWSAEVVETDIGQGINLSMQIENLTDKGVRMIDGRVFFLDILGRSIVNIEIEKDATIPQGGSFLQSGRYQSFAADVTRLATAQPDDIVATACVTAIVTTEGEVVRLDGVDRGSAAAPMTGAERDAFHVSIQGCWVVEPGSEAARVMVTVGFELGRDARVVGDVRMLSATVASESAVRSAFDAARRAILRCQGEGFPLPPDKFEQWRIVEMTFNPEQMRIR